VAICCDKQNKWHEVYRQVISEKSNQKRSETIKKLQKVECSVCGKSVFKRHLMQYHEDKCGKEYSESVKEKQRSSMANLPKFECSVCGKIVFKRHLVQYHEGKCRENKK